MNRSITIKTIKDWKQLEAVRNFWKQWQNHPNNDLGQFQIVCRLRQQVVCPFVLTVERDGHLCALLAARLERSYFTPSIGYFKPFGIAATVLSVLHEGLIRDADEESAEQLVQHLWSLLAAGHADAVTFHHLREDSPLLRALLRQGPRWWCEKRPQWSTHWSMTVPKEPGFLLKRLRSKHRSWIRRKERELESAFVGMVSWCWMNRFDDIPDLCARLETVASRTYQRGLGVGFADDEEHRERFLLFAGRGQLRVQLLEIGGEVRAFWIGIVYQDVFHSWATSYDPDLGRYEPGTLLFFRLVDDLVREGVQKLDFGLGNAYYKERFGDRSWRETSLSMLAPTAKGLAIRTAIGICAALDSAFRNFLKKAKLFDRIKTGWRRRLQK